jgi:hypothetical protein
MPCWVTTIRTTRRRTRRTCSAGRLRASSAGTPFNSRYYMLTNNWFSGTMTTSRRYGSTRTGSPRARSRSRRRIIPRTWSSGRTACGSSR